MIELSHRYFFVLTGVLLVHVVAGLSGGSYEFCNRNENSIKLSCPSGHVKDNPSASVTTRVGWIFKGISKVPSKRCLV